MHPYSTNSPIPPKHIAMLMLAAVMISAAIGAAAQAVNARWGWALGGVSSMTLFGVLHFFFDRVAWKWRWLRRILLVPDLNGEWACEGRTAWKNGKPESFEWNAGVTVRQSWSKITIVLRTTQSASESIAASLYCVPGQGYRLIYHYENKPRVDQPDIARHSGLCDLLIAENAESAEGEYFTGKDRVTAGAMRLKRKGALHAKA